MKTYKEFMEDSYMKRKLQGKKTARKSKKKREREAKRTKSAKDYMDKLKTIFSRKAEKGLMKKQGGEKKGKQLSNWRKTNKKKISAIGAKLLRKAGGASAAAMKAAKAHNLKAKALRSKSKDRHN